MVIREEIFCSGRFNLILENNHAVLYFEITDIKCLQTADSWPIQIKVVIRHPSDVTREWSSVKEVYLMNT